MSDTVGKEKPLLLGCGILQKEIRMLQAKNHWEMDTHFLQSALHIHLQKLQDALTSALEEHRDRECIVFYGACHPLMDEMLEQAHTFRTRGVNCLEMLLGKERYKTELENGAFFLLEEWAFKWDEVIDATFHHNEEVMRRVFQEDRKYILAVRTPTSGDFSKEAEAAAKKVGLPLRTMEVSLEHLETVLQEALERRRKETG